MNSDVVCRFSSALLVLLVLGCLGLFGCDAVAQDDFGFDNSSGEESNPSATPQADDGDDSVTVTEATPLPFEAMPCEEAGNYIFVVDTSRRLHRFYPPDRTLELVGTIGCGVGYGAFSMSISREGVAYVLFSSGALNEVSLYNAACRALPYSPGQSKFVRYGMGFSTNGSYASEETLFIANTSDYYLGSLNTEDWLVTPIASLTGSPELTGNALGELWGFFPDLSPPLLAQIDKETALLSGEIELGTLISSPMAWAVAYWGNHYFIFYQSSGDASTNIYEVSADTGDYTLVVENVGVNISGAGVSTCAPVDNW